VKINTNINATIAANALAKNDRAMNQAMERLSTGLRINSAADDAAGLAISSRMSAQINGLNQAVRNAQDAMSMLQTAEGAMVAMTDMLQRMRELSIQAISDTNTTSDRAALDLEYQALKSEIDRIALNTEWNGRSLFDGSGYNGNLNFQIGAEAGQKISVELGTLSTMELGDLNAGKSGDGYGSHAMSPPLSTITGRTFLSHASSVPGDTGGSSYISHNSVPPVAEPLSSTIDVTRVTTVSDPFRAWTQMGGDIDGKEAGERAGLGMLSGGGDTLVVAAPAGTDAVGKVRAFDWDGTNWAQRGQDISAYANSENNFVSVLVAVSDDGNILAVGESLDDSAGKNAGQTKVFEWNGSAWVQRGGAISGDEAGDGLGASVALSADGNTLAIGAFETENDDGTETASARVFDWNGTAWIKRGADIDAETAGEESTTVRLSADGNTLAVGGLRNDASAQNSGNVRVFDWNGNAWVKRGLDIDGDGVEERAGLTALSDDGNTLAIGSYLFDLNSAANPGRVRVFDWDGSTWVQRGNDLIGERPGDVFGITMSLSGDGNSLSVSAPGNDGNGPVSGGAFVYDWNGSAWVQRGQDIDGENMVDVAVVASLSKDGKRLAIGSQLNDGNGIDSGHFRVFEWPTQATGNQETINFSGRNIGIGDTLAINIPGGDKVQGVVGSDGLDALLTSLASKIAAQTSLFSSASAGSGTLTLTGKSDGSALPAITLSLVTNRPETFEGTFGTHQSAAPTPTVTESATSSVKAGSEFKVNTYTSGNQGDPAITNLSNGGFVVTWTNESSQDGSGYGVFGQMYNASGNTVGAEFQVNTHTSSNQRHPDIAGLSDGGFVVTWHSRHQDGDDQGIFGQRFDASGNKSGAEFQVNTHTTSFQQYSAVTSLTDGGFVVTWHDDSGHDGSDYGVFGQRYSSSGSATGSQFQINSTTASDQAYPSISSLSGGGFVATWTDYSGEDGSGKGIFGQRYDASGNKVASEFQINTHTSGDQSWSDIASLPNGGFVVTWNSSGQDSSGEGVYAQRYSSSGEKDGTEFRVNTYQTGNEMHSEVTALNDGGYVVIWYSDTHTDDTNYGIHGQRFDASGAAVGSQFLVNTDTSNAQQYPEIAPLADGGFVITWQSYTQDGSGYGIYAQRFASTLTPATAIIDFSDRNLAVGDKVVIEIAGGTAVKGVIGSNGLDGLLTSLSSSLTAQDAIFSAASSSSGVLTLTGLASGASLPAVTVSFEKNSTTNQNLINFNGKNIVLGDRITIDIDGGTQVQGVLGSQGLDGLLASIADELSAQSALFGSVTSQNGILYMNGPDANTDPPRATVNLEDALYFSTLDFNGKNLVEGDRITLNISGGQKVEAVVGTGGLDATLASMAADAEALSGIYSSASANSGVLTLIGLLDASSMPGVTVTLEDGTNREARIDFSDRNLMEGDRINLVVAGGNSIQAVVGPNGLDATLSSIASDLAFQTGLFRSASASGGVITYKGLETGPAVADITVTLESLNNSQALFPTAINSFDSAVTAMERIDTSVTQINERRASFGAVINRLDFAADNLSNIALNTEASRSRIEDADYAAETTALARTQIIQQAATAMLAQANMQSRQVLELLELDG
jgi:flagellin-like hook-associated protein FlgL